MKPRINKIHVLSCQVCVPKDWTDEQIVAFAEKENPCGTITGWHVRKQDSPHMPAGEQERVVCDVAPDMVHVVLLA